MVRYQARCEKWPASAAGRERGRLRKLEIYIIGGPDDRGKRAAAEGKECGLLPPWPVAADSRVPHSAVELGRDPVDTDCSCSHGHWNFTLAWDVGCFRDPSPHHRTPVGEGVPKGHRGCRRASNRFHGDDRLSLGSMRCLTA